jgi:hypothetical protein
VTGLDADSRLCNFVTLDIGEVRWELHEGPFSRVRRGASTSWISLSPYASLLRYLRILENVVGTGDGAGILW